MSRCEFTSQAHADLLDIHDYIARDSFVTALQFVERLEQHCYLLADSPLIGRLRPELGRNLRSYVVPRTSYIVFYRPVDDGVEIIHVVHGSRNLLRLFEN